MPTRPITVGTSPTQIVAYNNKRTSASFTNNGTATIFVSEDQNALATNGYPIPVGGALDLIRAFGDEPQLEWFGLVAAATQNLRVLEAFGQLPELIEPPARLGVVVAEG